MAAVSYDARKSIHSAFALNSGLPGTPCSAMTVLSLTGSAVAGDRGGGGVRVGDGETLQTEKVRSQRRAAEHRDEQRRRDESARTEPEAPYLRLFPPARKVFPSSVPQTMREPLQTYCPRNPSYRHLLTQNFAELSAPGKQPGFDRTLGDL